MNVLITGAAGFIGHHVVEHILKTTDWSITILDRLTYASNGFDRLREIGAYDNKRVRIFTADITQKIGYGLMREIGNVDYILHLAAETHVDNSIKDPWPFIEANVIGTYRMLEFAKDVQPKKFFYFSTDEVFGPAPKGILYKEWDRYNSTNPYSATKAGGEELCLAWANTYGVPVVITHTMNAFGERQHWEKFIPKVIRKVLRGETVEIHASADKQISGSRFYIHARNIASALLFLMVNADIRDKYNIVGEREVSNLELAVHIANLLGKPLRYEMIDFHSSRPGHDLRYSLDGEKLAGMGWVHPVSFWDSLNKTILWTAERSAWLGE